MKKIQNDKINQGIMDMIKQDLINMFYLARGDYWQIVFLQV